MYDEILKLLKENAKVEFTLKDAKDILDSNRYKLNIEEVKEKLMDLVQFGYLSFSDYEDTHRYTLK
ncbi:MAG: hypothetical protein E6748_04270 [Clostridium perfringens]|nr:hypothetical protein [Clostridium perfringens]